MVIDWRGTFNHFVAHAGDRLNHIVWCAFCTDIRKYLITIQHLHTHPPSSLFRFISHPMDTINLPFRRASASTPSTGAASRLHCPAASCRQHIPWDKVELMHSKTTYTCPHCQSAFCLACGKPPSTHSDHELTSKCLLNSTATGVLSNLLFFHEALLVLRGLYKTREQFELWQRGNILDPKFMSDVDEVIDRTNTVIEDSKRIVDDFYTVITQAEKERAKAEEGEIQAD